MSAPPSLRCPLADNQTCDALLVIDVQGTIWFEAKPLHLHLHRI
jgi:hypothetical protein